MPMYTGFMEVMLGGHEYIALSHSALKLKLNKS